MFYYTIHGISSLVYRLTIVAGNYTDTICYPDRCKSVDAMVTASDTLLQYIYHDTRGP
jgi:hypothetical protein